MRRITLAVLAALVTLAAGLGVVVLTSRGEPSSSPPRPLHAPPDALPSGAATVSTSAGLIAALARTEPRDIVLADGSYDNARPFVNTSGHRVYAQHLGGARLDAGFVLGGSAGGGVLKGLSFDVGQPDRTFQGAIVYVRGTGPGNQLLDLTLDGHGAVASGIFVRQAEGLVVRIVARNSRLGRAGRSERRLTAAGLAADDRGCRQRERLAAGAAQLERHLGSVRLAGGDRDRAPDQDAQLRREGLWVEKRDARQRLRGSEPRRQRDRDLRRALRQRLDLPARARGPERDPRRDLRVGRSRLGSQAGLHEQRVRGLDLRHARDRGRPREGPPTRGARSIFVHRAAGQSALRGGRQLGTRRATITAASQRALSGPASAPVRLQG